MNESSASRENRFDWADPLLLDESLSEDERMAVIEFLKTL